MEKRDDKLTIDTEFVRQAFLIGGSDQIQILLEYREPELHLLRVLVPLPVPVSEASEGDNVA